MDRMDMSDAGSDMALDAEVATTELIQVMDDLKELFLTENEMLSRGLPAALVEMADRKTELSEEFAERYRDVFSRHADELAANPELRDRLMESGHELQDLSMENMWRLEAALKATRRRIDAVMTAIRDHDRENRTYGEGGLATGGQIYKGSLNNFQA